jgi:hypothetical protein
LRLADAVLGAKPLLLAETNSVVAVCLATGATVLARRIGALLEVTGSFGGQRDSECTRQSGLRPGTGGGGQVKESP